MPSTEAYMPRAHALQQEKPLQWDTLTPLESSLHSKQLEKAHAQQRRASMAKNRKINFKKSLTP